MVKTIHFPDFHPFTSDVKMEWHFNNFESKLKKLAKKHNLIVNNFEYPNCNENYEFFVSGIEENLKNFYAEFMGLKNVDLEIENQRKEYGGFYEEDFKK